MLGPAASATDGFLFQTHLHTHVHTYTHEPSIIPTCHHRRMVPDLLDCGTTPHFRLPYCGVVMRWERVRTKAAVERIPWYCQELQNLRTVAMKLY
jgi:hypothetical protein